MAGLLRMIFNNTEILGQAVESFSDRSSVLIPKIPDPAVGRVILNAPGSPRFVLEAVG